MGMEGWNGYKGGRIPGENVRGREYSRIFVLINKNSGYKFNALPYTWNMT